jgi:hypothetical protein
MHMRRVRRGVVLSFLLAGATMAGATGSASAAGWLAPQDVPLSVSDLGFDEDGNAIAVGIGAGASPGADPVVRAMVRPAGGQWSAPVPVSGSGDGDLDAPQVAVNARGDAVAVWSAGIGSTGAVRVSARPAGGAWSDPHVISEGAVYGGGQDVAIDAQGNATVIWSEIVGDEDPSWLVRAASRPSGGNWSEPENLSESALAASPRLAVDPEGDVTAVWLGTAPRIVGPGVVNVVRSSRRPAGGEWDPASVALSSEEGTASAEAPQVAVDAQGNATAVWASLSGGSYVAQTARRAAGGDWGDPSTLGSGHSAQVAVDPQGNATAIWASTTASSSTVLSSGRTAAGQWSAPAPMATGGEDDGVSHPWVAADPQGDVTAIWARHGTDGELLAQATRHAAGSSSWSPAVDLPVGRPITALPAAGVDPQGHVSIAWSKSEDPGSGASSVLDPIGPELRKLTAPATATVGKPVALSVEGFDVWSPVTIAWDFGDGQSAEGAAVSHTYGSPGERTVTITGVDAQGNTTKTSRTITVDPVAAPAPPAPGPGPGPGPAPGPGPGPVPTPKAPKAPLLSGLQQSSDRWRISKPKRGPKLPVGTTLRFKLDRAAQVQLTFSRIVSGRRAGGRCVKAGKGNRGKPRCDRARSAGTLQVAGKAGSNAIAFNGKLRGRALAPGRYRLLVTATANGKTSTAKSLRFTIVA